MTISRMGYYIFTAVFMAIAALVSFVQNTYSTGITSDIYIVGFVISLIISGMSLIYMGKKERNENDDEDVVIVGLPFGKKFYYISVLAISAWTALSGYQLNHAAHGMTSVWGLVCMIAGGALAVFSWFNYKSYTTK